MKSKFIPTILLVFILATYSKGQLINESFSTSLPIAWTQWSSSSITWGHSSTFDCAESYEASSAATGQAWLQTPFVNLSQLTNPELNFDMAMIRNNFMAPDISLWYDIGAGWVLLQSWGGLTGATFVSQTSDYVFPLDSVNVTWLPTNYDLSALASNTNIRFSFGVEFTNGGWALIDNVVLQSGGSVPVYPLPYVQDFEGGTFLPTDWESFGATNVSWQQNTSVGGFGNSSNCAYFDNFSQAGVSGNFYGMRAVNLDLTGATQPTLTFDVAYAQPNVSTSDRLGIWYSFNGTTGWTSLINYDFSNLTTAPNQASLFTPTAQQWETKTISLNQFIGTSFIRFAFENNSSGGNAVYIDNVHFFDAALTSTDQFETADLPRVYPSPFQDRLLIQDAKNIKSIRLFNALGEEVYQAIYHSQNNQIEMNGLNNLPNQLYFLVADTFDGKVMNFKVLKQE